MKFMLVVLFLTAIYLATLGSTDPVDAAVGAAVVVILLTAFHPGARARAEVSLRRIGAALRFCLVVLSDVVVGTWDVTLVVVGRRPLRSPGIVAVPIAGRTRAGVVVTTLSATLAPGEFLVDVDEERGVMLFHELDASDPEAVRARHRERYERHQRRFLP